MASEVVSRLATLAASKRAVRTTCTHRHPGSRLRASGPAISNVGIDNAWPEQESSIGMRVDTVTAMLDESNMLLILGQQVLQVPQDTR